MLARRSMPGFNTIPTLRSATSVTLKLGGGDPTPARRISSATGYNGSRPPMSYRPALPLPAFLKAFHAAAALLAKNALGRPTNRAWPKTPLTKAGVVIGVAATAVSGNTTRFITAQTAAPYSSPRRTH